MNEFEYIDVGVDDDCDEFVDDWIVTEDSDVVDDDDDEDEDDDDVWFALVIVVVDGPVVGDNDDNLNIISTNKTLTGNKMSKHA